MAFNAMNKSKASSFLFKLHNDLIDAEFYIVGTSLPSVELEMNSVKAPSLTYPVPSNILTYGEFPITVLSDEGMEIWVTLFEFLTKKTNKPERIFTDIEYPKFEAVLYILSNKGTVIKKVIYHDCYLKKVSPYDLTINDDKTETFTADFAYSYCEIERVE